MGLKWGGADELAEVALGGAVPATGPKIGLKHEARGLTAPLVVTVAAVADEEEEGGFTTLARLKVVEDCAGWGMTWLNAELDIELGSWMVGATAEDDCAGFRLGCARVALGCVGLRLGCARVTLGCVGLRLGCARLRLGCAGVVLGCARLRLG